MRFRAIYRVSHADNRFLFRNSHKFLTFKKNSKLYQSYLVWENKRGGKYYYLG